jgi:hypothetical protein
MKSILISFCVLFLSCKCFCQYLPEDMRQGLKGNVSFITTTRYYEYPKGVAERNIQIFDRQNRFIKAITYDTTQKISTDLVFKYDEKGRLLSYSSFAGKVMQFKVVNSYNASGLVTIQYSYLYTHGYPNSHFTLIKRFYSYNNNKQPIKIYTEQHGIDKSPYHEYFRYNDKGQKVERIREAYALNSTSKVTYAYNRIGEISQLIQTDPDNPVPFIDTTRYEYTGYDKVGNWHRKQEYHISEGKKEPKDIIIRKIAYFKK